MTVRLQRSRLKLLGLLNSTVAFIPVLVVTAMTAMPASADTNPHSPRIECLDPRLDAVVCADASIELLGEGFLWSEGPVWVKEGSFLLFSDIPNNAVMKYQEGAGVSLFLKPSGYTGTSRRGGKGEGWVDELGSNGLVLDDQRRLILCQHGNRGIARLDASLTGQAPVEARVTVLADRWEGKRFNSPNDIVRHSSGALYFTDPSYGLDKGGDPATREIDFNGVYRVAKDGTVTLATRAMTKPNGLAFSPDERLLYIGQSDRAAPLWRAFVVHDDGSLGEPTVFFDATELAASGRRGSPDGMKVDRQGHVFATGPGGVLVITPEGDHLGTIMTGDVVSNCAFGDDGRTLYMTSSSKLFRVRLETTGVGSF